MTGAKTSDIKMDLKCPGGSIKKSYDGFQKNEMSSSGEIGRRTGLKILGPLPDVPVQVRPRVPIIATIFFYSFKKQALLPFGLPIP